MSRLPSISRLICAIVVLIAPIHLAAQPASAARVGNFTVRFEKGGLYLESNGVPVLKGGVVQAFFQDNRQDDYGSGGKPPQASRTALPDGGVRYTAQFRDNGSVGAFVADQTIEVHPDGELHFVLRASWSGAKPASLEWNPIRLWSYALLGAEYSATTVSPPSVVTGRIGRTAASDHYPENRLSTPWSQLKFESLALGAIDISSTNPEGLIAFDARRDPYIASQKVIWIGETDYALEPNRDYLRVIDMHLPTQPSAEKAADAPMVASKNSVHRVRIAVGDIASDADAARPDLLPRPKQAALSGSNYEIKNRQLNIRLDDFAAASPMLRIAVAEMQQDLKQDGLKLTLIPPAKPVSHSIEVSLEKGAENPASGHPEGYQLRSSDKGIEIVGVDPAGAFYGLQTLRQLLQFDTRGSAKFVGIDIVDWPSLPFRGAHIFVGKDALPYHTLLVRNVLSRAKLNALVLECEYTRWRSHPELWQPNSISPEDLEQDAENARTHFIQPIPLINTLGHSEWMFKNGMHTDLAEDIRSPHNYDPGNPATYKLVFDVFSEALDLFHSPSLFHIGHDEVKVPSYDTIGKYPARPANIAKGAGDLFLEDANRLADWLRLRGATSMMWGDMLLNDGEGAALPGVPRMTAAYAPTIAEAERRRRSIPKDAVLCDWRYEPGTEQRNGLALFRDAGHRAIGSAWFQPRNIQGWAREAARTGSLGTLQTTWAGYDINESTLETDFKQFSAYLLAANSAWTGGDPEPGINSSMAFRKMYRNEPQRPRIVDGWYLDLNSAANINLFPSGDKGVVWSAHPVGRREDRADTEPVLASERLSVPGANLVWLLGDHPGAVMLHGGANPLSLPVGYSALRPVQYPISVQLPLGKKAKTLAFLHACGFAADEGDVVGMYRIQYSDGTQAEIPLRYGYEIRALDDTAETGYSASPFPVRAGDALSLRLYRWTNPSPDKEIQAVQFQSLHPYAAPALFALSGTL